MILFCRISDAIEEWMNNNEVESCIEMHALSREFYSIIRLTLFCIFNFVIIYS